MSAQKILAAVVTIEYLLEHSTTLLIAGRKESNILWSTFSVPWILISFCGQHRKQCLSLMLISVTYKLCDLG